MATLNTKTKSEHTLTIKITLPRGFRIMDIQRGATIATGMGTDISISYTGAQSTLEEAKMELAKWVAELDAVFEDD